MAKKILVIDDEELIIKSLTKLLEKKGFEVIVVKRGQDAVAIVEEDNFDLIISDMRMPGMNGVETIENIQRVVAQKGASPPHVIFITGYADKDLEEQASRLHAAAYIYKPFDILTLINKIHEVLK